MITKISILRPNGADTSYVVDIPEKPSYRELTVALQARFDEQRVGAMVEHVSFMAEDGSRADMFVDEISASLGLPMNVRATRHYHRSSISREAYGKNAKIVDGVIIGAPVIYGVAAIFDRRVWF